MKLSKDRGFNGKTVEASFSLFYLLIISTVLWENLAK